MATTSHYLVLGPLEILAITWCGVDETGLPFLIGMLALLLLIPIQVGREGGREGGKEEIGELTNLSPLDIIYI